MVQRAKFATQKAYPSDLVVLGLRSMGGSAEGREVVELGAVRLDRRTLEEMSSYSSLVRPRAPEVVNAKALRGSGIESGALAEAPEPKAVLGEFEKAIFSGGEAISRGRHRMILVLPDSCTGYALLGDLLERSGWERGRYGERVLDPGSIYLYVQGITGLKTSGSSLDLDAQLATFGLARPAVRDALEEARLTAEVLRRYQRIGVERERAYEVASLDPELLALVRDVEGRPKIKNALPELIEKRTGASGAQPRTWRERLARLALRGRAERERKAREKRAAQGGAGQGGATGGGRRAA